ncbi:hypothetical protein ACNPM4_00335 [Microbacterium sp. AGC62]
MTDLSGIDGVPNGRLTFRAVWGGPSPQAGFIEEVARIKQRLRTVEFSYQLDLFLTVGGEITPVPGPSGLNTAGVPVATHCHGRDPDQQRRCQRRR